MEAQLFVKMVLSSWNTQYAELWKLLDQLSDEQLQNETAPGRNRGIYLLGHLVAVTDGMLPLLDFGPRMYAQLDGIFVHLPDKSGQEMPTATTLKSNLKEINEVLSTSFNNLPAEQWFSRHTAVSEFDFISQPYRNKLNIIINRSNHMAYHVGQLVYLLK